MLDPVGDRPARKNLGATLSEKIYELIVDSGLRPGDKLPGHHQLAERFGVSVASIREALSILVAAGIVRSLPGRGTFLTGADLNPAGQQVDRALRILELFTAGSPVLSTAEIARELGLDRSAVHYLVAVLERRGFIVRDTSGNQYEVGPKAFEVGCLFARRVSLVEKAQPLLTALAHKTSCTVQLCILDRGEVLVVDSRESSSTVRVASNVGTRMPVHASAAGKVLLAFMDEPERSGILDRMDLIPYTSNTITEPEAFRRHLDEVRAQGYAISNAEWNQGVFAVAAPIREQWNRVSAALALATPFSHADDPDPARLIPPVCETARMLSFQGKVRSAPG